MHEDANQTPIAARLPRWAFKLLDPRGSHRFSRRTIALTVAALVVAVIAAVVVGWAPWSGSAVGPLQTSSVDGQPTLGMTSDAVLRGTCVDAEAYVTSTASDAVTLVGVSAVLLPGESLGRVACAGVATTGRGVAGAGGWPVPGVPVGKVAGARLPPGDSGIVFGITGPAKDRYYAVAGILVTYEYHGWLYSARGSGALSGPTSSSRHLKVSLGGAKGI
jgi:hypothetical protein